MNRVELRQMAEGRLIDAKTLMDAGRWSGAYYLAGYAMECGLKACVLAFVERTGAIFRDKEFSKKCFTHKMTELLDLSELMDPLNERLKIDRSFAVNWNIAKDWSEASRYQQKTENDAKALYDAIADEPNGVLRWIRTNW